MRGFNESSTKETDSEEEVAEEGAEEVGRRGMELCLGAAGVRLI